MSKRTFNQQAAQWDEIDKLREQVRRYKAAAARVRKCAQYPEIRFGFHLWDMEASDVLAALRLRK